MEFEIKVEEDHFKQLNQQIAEITGKSVMVGIPQENNARSDGPVGNAMLGYVFEFGSPATGMPPRPWLKPGMIKSQAQWGPYLMQALQAALTLGSTGPQSHEIDSYLRFAGEAAVAGIKRHIRSKIPPPLKPETIAARWRRHQNRRAGRPLPGESRIAAARRAAGRVVMKEGILTLVGSDVTPLVDEGAFINSITYVIQKTFTNTP
jgi:hypothetical protein